MEGGCDVAWGLIFVVVLMILLFGVVVPSISNGRNSQRYERRVYDDRGYDGRRYDDRDAAASWPQEPPQRYVSQRYSQPLGSGCRQMLILVFVVFLFFVGAIIYWSVTVQAGGGLF
jgi:hypothetical protein